MSSDRDLVIVARVARASLLIALLVAGCGSAAPSPAATANPSVVPSSSQPTAAPTASAPGPSMAPGADAAGIVWLCRPGMARNPCEATLTTTVIDPSGGRTVETLVPAPDPPIDCFYVYPTFSRQKGPNASLSVDPELVTIATWQAAPFSQVCKVFAPVYPQVTIAALNSGAITPDAMMTAYTGVASAFEDYLANDNHGRGFVLIGHSQGAMYLVSLLEDLVVSRPAVRSHVVSALLLGGSATTTAAKAGGGASSALPACTAVGATGCVVGYSSFAGTPPPGAMFGRVATAATMLRRPQPGEQIMCVNPATPGGTAVFRQPLIAASDLPNLTSDPPKPLPTTTFVSYPNAYSAVCKLDGDAAWLEVTRINPHGAAPVLVGTEGRTWGLHDFDVSLPAGDLLDLVRAQSAAFRP
jgi:Protein of unknown function (DUF3089)